MDSWILGHRAAFPICSRTLSAQPPAVRLIESTTTFDAERELAPDFFFRASNTWSWVEGTTGLLYDVPFGVRQPVDGNRALGYECVNLFRTRPIHEVYEIVLRVRYRQQLWREWAFLEIAPQYRFPKTQSFHGLAGIMFRLEIVFGNYWRRAEGGSAANSEITQ